MKPPGGRRPPCSLRPPRGPIRPAPLPGCRAPAPLPNASAGNPAALPLLACPVDRCTARHSHTAPGPRIPTPKMLLSSSFLPPSLSPALPLAAGRQRQAAADGISILCTADGLWLAQGWCGCYLCSLASQTANTNLYKRNTGCSSSFTEKAVGSHPCLMR